MTTTPPSAGPAEVRRYSCRLLNSEFHQDPDGAWVYFDAYSTLSAQCAAQARELAELRERVTAFEEADTSQQPYSKGWQDGRDDSWNAYKAQLEASQQAVAEREARIAVIYDGHRVLTEVKRNAKAAGRTSPENVSDVLDAIARIWKEPT